MSIKIYNDRSKTLNGTFQNEHVPWHDLEGVQDGSVKEGVLACDAKVWSWVRLKTQPWQKIEKNEQSFPMPQS